MCWCVLWIRVLNRQDWYLPRPQAALRMSDRQRAQRTSVHGFSVPEACWFFTTGVSENKKYFWCLLSCIRVPCEQRKETTPVIFFFISLLRPKKQKSDGSTCTPLPVLCRHVTTILTLKGLCFCTVVTDVGKFLCFAESARLASTVYIIYTISFCLSFCKTSPSM